MPSSARVGPGKLGYYNGGWIVRSHAKLAGVDSLQVDIYNIYSHIYSAIYNIYSHIYSDIYNINIYSHIYSDI